VAQKFLDGSNLDSLDSRFRRDFNQVIYLTLEHLFEPEVEFKII